MSHESLRIVQLFLENSGSCVSHSATFVLGPVLRPSSAACSGYLLWARWSARLQRDAEREDTATWGSRTRSGCARVTEYLCVTESVGAVFAGRQLEWLFLVLHDGVTRATHVMIVGKHASVCRCGQECTSSFRGSGARMLIAVCVTLCALLACLKVSGSRHSVWDRPLRFLNGQSQHHPGFFNGKLPHQRGEIEEKCVCWKHGTFDNVVDLTGSEGFGQHEADHIKPLMLVSSSPNVTLAQLDLLRTLLVSGLQE